MILKDLVSVSSGSGGYGYSIPNENINCLIPNIDILTLINETNQINNKEMNFIKEIYEKSISTKDPFEKGVYSNEYIEL